MSNNSHSLGCNKWRVSASTVDLPRQDGSMPPMLQVSYVTCNPNHWSNEEKIKQYIEIIFLLYLERKHKELELPPDQPARAIFDVFKGQQTGQNCLIAGGEQKLCCKGA